jgi:hypothetical protein
MGAKYFKGRMLQGDRTYRYVVWDGVRDYKSIPPVPQLVVAERLSGETLGIVQVKKRVSRSALSVLLQAHGSVIFWARDHAVYRAIVDGIEAFADARMQ